VIIIDEWCLPCRVCTQQQQAAEKWVEWVSVKADVSSVGLTYSHLFVCGLRRDRPMILEKRSSARVITRMAACVLHGIERPKSDALNFMPASVVAAIDTRET
jgi:hypothetical protein